MQNHEFLRTAIGSHNIRSIAYAVAAAEHCEVPPAGFELQMLYGMADAEKKVFVDRGRRLRVYMPYGELIPGMAYLVRRLLENTSNDSFLRMSFAENVAVEKLLNDPNSVGQVSRPTRAETNETGRSGDLPHERAKPLARSSSSKICRSTSSIDRPPLPSSRSSR